jgi:hypothetical protein
MMLKILGKAFAVFLLAFFASGCLAPLSSSFTGRSAGRGKVELDGGVLSVGGAIPAFKCAVGLSSAFDLGVQLECASIGGFAKYSLINNQERGFSLAGVAGGGAVASGSYFYAGLALSYLAKSFEPYFVARFNVVHYGEPNDLFEDVSWEAGTYTYFQFTLGTIIWATKHIGFDIEGSAFAGDFGLRDFEDFAVPSVVVLAGVKLRL